VNDKDYTYIRDIMNNIAKTGEKVWGGAYVITTHGIPMSKTDYLVDRVLPSAVNKIPRDYPNLKESAQSFMEIEGVSTFLAGQILADLKNTKGHLLEKAPDWWSFALPGPGSRRGMDWLYAERVPESRWSSCLHDLQSMLQLEGITLCAQDTQNCLCEYDKWCRVTLGTGRSKRKYYGT
jgi:hypothetical protein